MLGVTTGAEAAGLMRVALTLLLAPHLLMEDADGEGDRLIIVLCA